MAEIIPIRQTEPAKLDEVAYWERSLYAIGASFPRFNPDSLVRHKGLAVYYEMRADEQIKAVMQFKRDAIFGRGWSFTYDYDTDLPDDEQARRMDIFNYLLTKSIEGSFEDGLNLIATGRDYGFSLTEKVFTEVKYKGSTLVGLRMLLLKDPRTFYFITDEYGMLVRCEQWVNGRKQDVDLSKFIHYVHNPEFDRWFGRSDLREAYKAWYIKGRLEDYWALYLERFAGGFMVLTQGADANLTPNTPVYESLKTVLLHLHGATGIMLPKGVTAQLMFPPSGQDPFAAAIEQKNLAIAKAILVPNLLGLSEHSAMGRGGTAQAQTQLEAFTWTLNSDARRVESLIDEQLIRDLGDQNFGDGQYPSFRFKPLSEERMKWIVTTWATLTQNKVVVSTEEDEAFIRGLMEMPDRAPDEPGLTDPGLAEQQDLALQGQQAAVDAAKAAAANGGAPPPKAANEEFTRAMADALQRIELRLVGLEGSGGGDRTNRSGNGDALINQGRDLPPVTATPHGRLRAATLEQFSQATQRVAFAVLERRQEATAQDLRDQLAGQVARATARVLGTDGGLAGLTAQDVEAAEPSSAEKGRMNQACRRALAQAWDLGAGSARNELDRARAQHAAHTGTAFARRGQFADLRDQAAAYFDARAFRMAGDVSDRARNMIQQELMNSLKYGRSPTQTREAVWGRLLDQGLTTRTFVQQNETDEDVTRALDELGVASEAAATSYLDTLARTNLFEAMNEARFAEFTDPELGGFVQAMEYSAVLDDRTTDICAELDGDTWDAENQLWDIYRPPNHFNCRSVLVPVTQADGWDGTEDPPPDVVPDPGFGAGAK